MPQARKYDPRSPPRSPAGPANDYATAPPIVIDEDVYTNLNYSGAPVPQGAAQATLRQCPGCARRGIAIPRAPILTAWKPQTTVMVVTAATVDHQPRQAGLLRDCASHWQQTAACLATEDTDTIDLVGMLFDEIWDVFEQFRGEP